MRKSKLKEYAIHCHLSTELSNQLSYTVSGLAVGDRGPLQSAPVANLCQDAPELRKKCNWWSSPSSDVTEEKIKGKILYL